MGDEKCGHGGLFEDCAARSAETNGQGTHDSAPSCSLISRSAGFAVASTLSLPGGYRPVIRAGFGRPLVELQQSRGDIDQVGEECSGHDGRANDHGV